MFELVRNVATLSPRAGTKIIFPTDNSSPSNYAAFRYQTIVGNNSRCFDVVARRFSNTLFPRDPFSKNSRIRVLHVYTITRVHVSTIVQTIARSFLHDCCMSLLRGTTVHLVLPRIADKHADRFSSA